MKSWRSSAASMPSAEKCAGYSGTITLGMCNSRAIAITCKGPAPPEATSAKSRGSKPFATETSRTASDIFEIAISTAACAHFDDIDHRQHHRVPAGIAADIVAGRERRLAVAHEARFGGGAAHVEGDHVLEPEREPDLRRGDDPAHRPRLHHGNGPLGRDFRRHHAAVRAHDR